MKLHGFCTSTRAVSLPLEAKHVTLDISLPLVAAVQPSLGVVGRDTRQAKLSPQQWLVIAVSCNAMPQDTCLTRA